MCVYMQVIASAPGRTQCVGCFEHTISSVIDQPSRQVPKSRLKGNYNAVENGSDGGDGDVNRAYDRYTMQHQT